LTFRIQGLDPASFRHLYSLSDTELACQGVRRVIADSKPGFPDRIEMRDAEPGEKLLLLNYTHQPADTPFKASHAIFIREGADVRYDRLNEIPEVLHVRTISLRAFDDAGMMRNAELASGEAIRPAIERLLADPNVAYLHAHYAKMGCFAARIDRAGQPRLNGANYEKL
jgi:hypothetical protein